MATALMRTCYGSYDKYAPPANHHPETIQRGMFPIFCQPTEPITCANYGNHVQGVMTLHPIISLDNNIALMFACGHPRHNAQGIIGHINPNTLLLIQFMTSNRLPSSLNGNIIVRGLHHAVKISNNSLAHARRMGRNAWLYAKVL